MMPGMMGPIGKKMRGRMPVVMPRPLDEGMEFPGGGDLGMEMSEPYEQGLPENPFAGPAPLNPMMEQGNLGNLRMQPDQGARAFPVHSRPEMEAEYNRMGMQPSDAMRSVTSAYEKAPPGPIKSKMHATQHQMMVGDQNAVLQAKRMELAQKTAELESRLQTALRSGKLVAGSEAHKRYNAAIAGMREMLNSLPVE